MAEIAVGFLVDRLATLAEEEIRMLRGVRNEIKNIEDEFKSIKILLRNADSVADIDEGAKEWVTQVRGVAYEIEDILDKYFLNRPHDTANSPESFVGSIHDVFVNIKGFFKGLKSQHKFGNEILDIKGRILEISSRKERYRLSSLDGASSSATTAITKHDPREDSLFLDEAQLVGTEEPIQILTGYIIEANVKLSVVSVLGEGGLGKTTIVKKVFDSPSVKGQFEHRAWVTISQTPDFKILLTDLLRKIFPQLEAEDSVIKLKQQLNDNLRGKRYIVVLDDIWTLPAWRELKHALPDDNKSGSRILVTTRQQEVAATCIQGCGHMYSLKCLDPEQSWKLFYMKTCDSSADDMLSYPEDLLKAKSVNFLKKCCGLPLAIVAMGGLLSMKQLGEWDQVYQTLGSLPLQDLNLVISLSFNDLPYYLKSCFLYLCMFPEDYSIQCSRLLRQWVAQGFVETTEGFDVTVDKIAKSYLDELIKRSLVQADYIDERKKVVSCKIHDVMRDFIIGKARDQNFVRVIARKEDELQLFTGDGGTRMLQQSRHLSICVSKYDDGDEGTISVRKNNRLVVHSRSLLVSQQRDSYYLTNMFSSFGLLKVLDLEDVNLKEFPDEVVNLFYLRYLNLRSHGRIKSLPNTVEKLVNLETLDIKRTGIRELPITILKLKQLRNLLMGSHYQAVDLLEGIGRLINLEKLGGVCWNAFAIKEMWMLNRLRRLSVHGLKTDDGNQLFACIQRLKYLTSLKMWFANTELLDAPSLWSPPLSLQSLYIEGSIMNIFPGWFSSLRNLEKLTLILRKSRLKYDPFQVLQRLPNLVSLRLESILFMGDALWIRKHGFPRLKKLLLLEFYDLNHVEVEQKGMPAIQSITFGNCNNLNNIPHGINHLHALKTIVYSNMPGTFVDQLRDRQNILHQQGILLQVEDFQV